MGAHLLTDEDIFGSSSGLISDDELFGANPDTPAAPADNAAQAGTMANPAALRTAPQDAAGMLVPNPRIPESNFAPEQTQNAPVQVQAGQPQGQMDTANNVGMGQSIARRVSNVPENYSMAIGGMQQRAGEAGIDQATQDIQGLRGVMDGSVTAPNAYRDGMFLRWAKDNGKFPSQFESNDLLGRIREIGSRMSDSDFSDYQAYLNEPNNATVKAANERIAAARETLVDPGAEAGSLAYYVSESVGAGIEMIPAIVGSLIARNPTPAMAMMGVYSAGRSYESARQEGANPKEARLYSELMALAEGLGEAVPVSMIIRPGSTFITKSIKGALGEAINEQTTEVLQIGLDMGILDKDMTWDEARGRIIDAGIIGAGAGQVMAIGAQATQAALGAAQSAGRGMTGALGGQAASQQAGAMGAETGMGANDISQATPPQLGEMGQMIDAAMKARGAQGLVRPPLQPDLPVDTSQNTLPPVAETVDVAPASPIKGVQDAPAQTVRENLRSFIGDNEAPRGYDQVYGGSRIDPPKPITSMTINEVLDWQDQSVSAGSDSSAAGRFQIIRGTLRGLVKSLGLSGNEVFSEEMQNQLADQLMNEAGLSDFEAGNMTAEQLGNNLSRVWAALPRVTGDGAGSSTYAGDGLNAATTDVGTFMGILTGGEYTPSERAGGSGVRNVAGRASTRSAATKSEVAAVPSPDLAETSGPAEIANDPAQTVDTALRGGFELQSLRDYYDGKNDPASQAVIAEIDQRIAAKTIDGSTPQEGIQQEAAGVESSPTQGQIKAGNYKKGHIKVGGLDVTIENAQGDVRRGVDENGKKWETKMPGHYGYVKRTRGADGDNVDIYVGKVPEYSSVYVVDQINHRTGKFDEHKAITGVKSLKEATALYEKGFSDGAGAARIGNITKMSMKEFKAWLKDGSQNKPVQALKGINKKEIYKAISDLIDRNAVGKSGKKALRKKISEMLGPNVQQSRVDQEAEKYFSELQSANKKRKDRYKRKLRQDPLEFISETRSKSIKLSKEKNRLERENSAAEATRKNLIAAATTARFMGLNVQKSTDRNGHVSSYYVKVDGKTARISDHELPSTPRREANNDMYGGMPEVIIDSETTKKDVERFLTDTFSLKPTKPRTIKGALHGTAAAFTKFDPKTKGKHFPDDIGYSFTNDRTLANNYAGLAAGKAGRSDGGTILKADLTFENPLEIKAGKKDPSSYWFANRAEIEARAKKGGHDGIIVSNTSGKEMYVALRADQISVVADQGKASIRVAEANRAAKKAAKKPPKSTTAKKESAPKAEKTFAITSEENVRTGSSTYILKAGQFAPGTGSPSFATSTIMAMNDTKSAAYSTKDYSGIGYWFLLRNKITGATKTALMKRQQVDATKDLPDIEQKINSVFDQLPDTLDRATPIEWKVMGIASENDNIAVAGLSDSSPVAIRQESYGYLVNQMGYTLAMKPNTTDGQIGIYEDGKLIGVHARAETMIIDVEYLASLETAEAGPVKRGKPATFKKTKIGVKPKRLSTAERIDVDRVRAEAITRLKAAEKEIQRKIAKEDDTLTELSVTKPNGGKISYKFQSTQGGIDATKRLIKSWKTTPAGTLYLEAPEIAALKFDQPMPNWQPMLRSQRPSDRPTSGSITVAGRKVALDPISKPTRAMNIRLRVEALIGTKIYNSKIKGKTRLGFYRKKNTELRTARPDDVETIAHEMAHWMDFHSSNKKVFTALRTKSDKAAIKQMESLSYTSSKDKVSIEGFAEYVRLWLTQYDVAKKVAPDFTALFEKTLDTMPDMRKKMQGVQNMMHKYYQQGTQAQFKANIGQHLSPTEIAARFVRSGPWQRLRFEMIDKLQGIKVMERELTGEIASDAAYSPFKMMQMVNGSESIYDTVIEVGTVRLMKDGIGLKVVGKPLNEIFKPINKDFNAFLEYAAARRADELMKQGRENLFTAFQIKDMLITETPEFITAFDEYQQFNREMLDFYGDMGMLTSAEIKAFKKNNKSYIPFHRIIEAIDTGKSGGGGIKALKGGTHNIRDLGANIIDSLSANIRLAMIAHAKSMAYNIIDTSENGGEFAVRISTDSKVVKDGLSDMADKVSVILSQLGYGVSARGMIISENSEDAITDISEIKVILEENPELLTVWQHGIEPKTLETGVDSVVLGDQRIYFEVIDPLFWRSMQSMQIMRFNQAVQAAMYVRRFMTRTITNMVQFVTPNLWRDTATASVTSDSGFIPIYDSLKGLTKTLFRTPEYLEWKANGGGYSNLAQNITESSRVHSRLALPSVTALDTAAKALASYDTVAAAFESATRVGEYSRAISKGVSPFEAAYRSREVSTDFSKDPGNAAWAAFLAVVPFMKASLNGTDRTAKVLIGEDGRIKKISKMRLARKLILGWGGRMALGTVLLWLNNNDDERYQGLTPDQKSRYWHVYIGENNWRIPRPYGVGFIFGDAVENMLDYIKYRDGKSVAMNMAWAFVNHFAFGDYPGVVQPMIEDIRNEKFTGAPIVQESMQVAPPEFQYTDRTPQIYREIGAALGFSPLRAEHYVKGYFGYMEQFFADATEEMLWDSEAWGERPFARGFADYFTKQFRGGTFAYRTKYTEGFYDLRSRAAGAQYVINMLEKEQIRNPDGAIAFISSDTNQMLIYLNGAINRISRGLSDIPAAVIAIKYDSSLSAAEKEAQIEDLYRGRNAQIEEFYKQAETMLNQIETEIVK